MDHKEERKALQRYFLWICYKGNDYYGWQKQAYGNTIQGCIEKAFAQVYGTVKVVGSSRTDRGTHAYGNVAHVDLPLAEGEVLQVDKLLANLNGVLPATIYIWGMQAVPSVLHARYSPISRRYVYHITRYPDPFTLDSAYYFRAPLDIGALNQAAALLIGEKDFASFCKKKAVVAHHYCDVFAAQWYPRPYGYIFSIQANRFLHGMVRSIVGTLLAVGLHKCSVEDFGKVLSAQDRNVAGMALPAHGLYLAEVAYPPAILPPTLGGGALRFSALWATVPMDAAGGFRLK